MGKKKNELMYSNDIMILPTKRDYFPTVILEAMRCGMPVISTREGAIPEIVDDGQNGFLVEKNSPHQIAEKIEYLINNPKIMDEMGQKGRKKYLENYTLDKFEQNMRKVFKSID